eukprot:TRINITY_DN23084_c0_g1_i1.p1 TRINITY_DN23084_c0_g1~~TRINITY_DN23084_c0_g1_i1.p1  ORF type:complete len:213 (+),score=24.06 TRINITY_DN23084_c0_g1_i1:68-706(+)
MCIRDRIMADCLVSKNDIAKAQSEMNSPLLVKRDPNKQRLQYIEKECSQIFLLKCSMCTEDYNTSDRRPKLLPCGHNTCECCLKRLLCSSAIFACHICKARCCSKDFPLSWPVLDLLSKLKRAEEKVERKADKCLCSREVSHYCRKHDEAMCGYCAMKHIKDCERSKILELSEVSYFIERTLTKSKETLLSLIHICRCRRYAVCRSRWSPYH